MSKRPWTEGPWWTSRNAVHFKDGGVAVHEQVHNPEGTATLISQAPSLYELLAGREWVMMYDESSSKPRSMCLECEEDERDGHAADCEMDRVLAASNPER